MFPQHILRTADTSEHAKRMNNNGGWNTEAQGSGGLNPSPGNLTSSYNQLLLQQQMLRQQQQQQLVNGLTMNKGSNSNVPQLGQQPAMKAYSTPFDLSFDPSNDGSATNHSYQTQPSLNEMFLHNGKSENSQKSQQVFLMELQQNLLQQQQQVQQQKQQRQLYSGQQNQQQQQQQGLVQPQGQHHSPFYGSQSTIQEQGNEGMVDQQHGDVFGDIRVFDTNSMSGNSGRPLESQNSNPSSNRILLGSKVEPFNRISKQDSDDNLFKLFEETSGDRVGTKANLNQPQEIQSSTDNEPALQRQQYGQAGPNQQLQYASLQQTFQAYTQQFQNQGTPSTSAEETRQKQTSQDFALLRQQEHEEEARLQKLCQVDQIQASQQSGLRSQLDEGNDEFGGQYFVPSTMIPPSVLASTLSTGSQKRKNADDDSAKASKKKRSRHVTADEPSPQKVFEQLVQKAGFNGSTRIKSDDAEYEVIPSALQLASFGTHLVKAVHTSDCQTLSDLLNCGLSPNPCNQFRDSVVDLVCKRGNAGIFQCLLDHGSDLQTVDGFGRTPLHHCCWASNFSRQIVDAILERDPIQLMIEDKHGQTPLEYVRPDLASDWIEYLESNIYKYWGGRVPQLSSPKESRPGGTLPDPANAIPINLASLVSAGKVSPEQVLPMIEKTNSTLELS